MYTEEAFGADAVSILKNGVKMTIDEILDELNSLFPGIESETTNEELSIAHEKKFDRSIECKLISIAIPRTRKKFQQNNDHFIKITTGKSTGGDYFSFRDATSTGLAYDHLVEALKAAAEDDQSGMDNE